MKQLTYDLAQWEVKTQAQLQRKAWLQELTYRANWALQRMGINPSQCWLVVYGDFIVCTCVRSNYRWEHLKIYPADDDTPEIVAARVMLLL
jgi:hypothetical protein